MTSWLSGLLFALLALSISLAHADESIFRPTVGSACTDRSRPAFSSWSCPGPGGYVAEYADEGNIVRVAIWMPRQRRTAARTVTWRGAGRVFGEKLQLRVSNGRPVATILRAWRTDRREREREELIVLKVAPQGACRVASINARQAGANELAEKRSERASVLPCLNDQ